MCSIRWRRAAGRRRVAVRVQGGRDGAVADRVRRALEPGAREARHDLGVTAGIGPERLGPLAVRAGLEQPGGARVDHAVDEELRRARAPAPAAAVAQGEQLLDLLVARLRLEQHGHDAAQRQVAARLELGDVVEQRGHAEHHVPAGEAERVAPPQGLGVGVEPLRARALRHPLAHQLHRRRLAQLAGRDAAVVAHHGRARAELARAVDAGERQGGPARQARVVVEEREERGRVADRAGDRVGADALAVEGVVGQPPAEHPLARRAASALGSERAADLVERAQASQVGPARAVGAVERVDVAVDQPGHERDPAAVDQLGRGAGLLAHLGVVADRDHDPVADRHRARARARGIERADRRSEDREVGRRHRGGSGYPWRHTSPSAVSTPSRIDLPQCGHVAVPAQSR